MEMTVLSKGQEEEQGTGHRVWQTRALLPTGLARPIFWAEEKEFNELPMPVNISHAHKYQPLSSSVYCGAGPKYFL